MGWHRRASRRGLFDYENVNGIINRLSGNEKVEKVKELHNKLEVDLAAYNKH